MRFVFPALFAVMIAMLFVSFSHRSVCPPPLPFSTSESDLPKRLAAVAATGTCARRDT